MFRVKVNGKALSMYQNQISSLAYFSFEGKTEVEITTTHDVKWVDVRPKNLNIATLFGGHTVKFSIDRPCNLSIEPNGKMTKVFAFVYLMCVTYLIFEGLYQAVV